MWRSACGGVRVVGPVVLSVVRGLLCRTASVLDVFLSAHQFRMQFPGYRTKRVGFMVTFRLVGAEKSVLKLVGANLKDGQNVLVL